MKLKNLAGDLHKKGELSKIEAMKKLANQIEKDSNGSLAGAFLTEGLYGKYDTIAIIANSKDYENKQGHVVYDNSKNKAIFISDKELENM